MSRKSVCVLCQQVRWTKASTQTCRPCSYPVGQCCKCKHHGKLYVEDLCYCCYQHRQVANKIQQLEDCFTPTTQYNGDLFKLYLIYIRRYRLAYFHIPQAQRLVVILAAEAWPTINCWEDVYRLSAKYNLNHANAKDTGCAVSKIALMLVELGVLSSNDDDYSKDITHKLRQLEMLNAGTQAEDMVHWLKKSGRRDSTIFNNLTYIHSYFDWVSRTYPNLDPFKAHESKIVEFLQHLVFHGYKSSQQRDRLQALHRFFARQCYLGKITINPCKGIETNKIQAKINIITETDLKKIIAYIRRASSPPEEALYLTLILFFGFKTEDLVKATLELQEDERFKIILHQSQRSCGNHFYNREQILELPQKPEWLRQLQERFLRHWLKKYQKTKQSFPSQRLVLPNHHHYTRSLHPHTMLKKIYSATSEATGHKITPKVLRQTCGHLHTRNGDGSVLATLGWSPNFAFHYTWLPRHIVTE